MNRYYIITVLIVVKNVIEVNIAMSRFLLLTVWRIENKEVMSRFLRSTIWQIENEELS